MPKEKLYYLGAKALIQNSQGRVLLLEIQKGDMTYFDLPGGRINEDETIVEALMREVQEETGIRDISSPRFLGMAPTSIQIPFMEDVRSGLILAIYSCKVVIPDTLQTEPNTQVVWCEKREVSAKLKNYSTELRDVIGQHLR